jgi:hypothetical protein
VNFRQDATHGDQLTWMSGEDLKRKSSELDFIGGTCTFPPLGAGLRVTAMQRKRSFMSAALATGTGQKRTHADDRYALGRLTTLIGSKNIRDVVRSNPTPTAKIPDSGHSTFNLGQAGSSVSLSNFR